MSKSKKIIIISVIVVIILIICGLFIALWLSTKEEKVGKLENYYEKLVNTNSYAFSYTLDNENNTYYAKQDDKAYIDSNYKNRNSKFIIKDGNTYLLKDSDKSYYTYTNNETDLYKIEIEINKIIENNDEDEISLGKEKIDNKNCKYEEFNGITKFYFGSTSDIDKQNVKTRFYFKNNELIYIKTIIDENTEQLLKVEYSEDVDSNLFDIPSNYERM